MFCEHYCLESHQVICEHYCSESHQVICEHYCSESHQVIKNWSVTPTDQVEGLDSLRKKDVYWINSLNTWAKNGLNEREVYKAYN